MFESMHLTQMSLQSFVWSTGALNLLVFFGSYLARVYGGLYLAEYFATVGLLVQVALIYRREAAIRWRWPWRVSYAVGLSIITYLFVSSAYAPSPAPFESEGLLKTEQVILRHYAIFLICVLPALLSCGLTPTRPRQALNRTMVTPGL
jgi:hypothetical protein